MVLHAIRTERRLQTVNLPLIILTKFVSINIITFTIITIIIIIPSTIVIIVAVVITF